MELKGSKTEANLMAAFAGESQARNKYTYYASKARKEGYEQIAAIFEETANNEKNMLRCGLRNFMEEIFLQLQKIYWMLLKVKIMNGLTCMLNLLK